MAYLLLQQHKCLLTVFTIFSVKNRSIFLLSSPETLLIKGLYPKISALNPKVLLILLGRLKAIAENLEQQQIESAKGDRTTRLPDYIEAPTDWRQSG